MNCHNTVAHDKREAGRRCARATPRACRCSGSRSTTCPTSCTSTTARTCTRGVGCVECHGRVDKMEVVYQAKPLTHGLVPGLPPQPGAHLRPPELVTKMDWTPGEDPASSASACARRAGSTLRRTARHVIAKRNYNRPGLLAQPGRAGATRAEFQDWMAREFPKGATELLEPRHAAAVPQGDGRFAGLRRAGPDRLPLAAGEAGAFAYNPPGVKPGHAEALRHGHGAGRGGRGAAGHQLRRPADQGRGQPDAPRAARARQRARSRPACSSSTTPTAASSRCSARAGSSSTRPGTTSPRSPTPHFAAAAARRAARAWPCSSEATLVRALRAAAPAPAGAAARRPRWYEYEPLSLGQRARGTRLAFGRRCARTTTLAQAERIVCLDADLLQRASRRAAAHARVRRRRRAEHGKMNRLYVGGERAEPDRRRGRPPPRARPAQLPQLAVRAGGRAGAQARRCAAGRRRRSARRSSRSRSRAVDRRRARDGDRPGAAPRAGA